MEAVAKVSARISLKHSIEICKAIRGMNVEKAINFLDNLIKKKIKLPCGRYHPNAAKEIMNLIKSAKANAENKG
ncbi:MAG TPA: 50S ribosomal protein L22, partial [Candidatus Aenigmarchaeota archaeon]|nr:50S ribosomal protein L22 [Candidatus Aenigmarchaeota archaeon]